MPKPKKHCPLCRSTKCHAFTRSSDQREYHKCRVCKSEWSATSQTIFRYSKVPPEKREFMLELLRNDPAMTTAMLAKLANTQQKTAWLFKRRVLEGHDAVKNYKRGGGRVGRGRRTVAQCAGLT